MTSGRPLAPIEKRLRATLGCDAINGDAGERSVATSQVREAVDEIVRLRARVAELATCNTSLSERLRSAEARVAELEAALRGLVDIIRDPRLDPDDREDPREVGYPPQVDELARLDAARAVLAAAARKEGGEKERREIERLQAEVTRLTSWLERIEGGDRPCTDEAELRLWAYEARTLGKECPQ